MTERAAAAGPPLWAIAATVGLMAAGFGSRPPARGALHNDDAGGDSRGRSADAPTEISPRGWKDIFARVYTNFTEHRILALAAGMTFYTLLAVFPALAALVAIYGLFFDPRTIMTHVDTLAGFAPSGAVEVAREQMARIASRGTQTLSVTFVVSLVISLWSANSAMKSLFDTLNVINGETEKRSFIQLNAESLAFTIAGIVFALLAAAAVVVVPVLFETLGLSGEAAVLLRFGRWPALLVVLTLALAVIYRYGPSREKPRWRWVSWGGAFAALLWLLASLLFSWYAANFGKFNETYGSLGAVIGFMTWLWLSATAVLLGAEVDAEAEHQTARDTTEANKPLGARGATMADEVA